jgi:metal-sulfur cluster biosynthetic enzyme
MMTLENKVKEHLKALIDPETDLAFREMGLIKELRRRLAS